MVVSPGSKLIVSLRAADAGDTADSRASAGTNPCLVVGRRLVSFGDPGSGCDGAESAQQQPRTKTPGSIHAEGEDPRWQFPATGKRSPLDRCNHH